MAKLDPRIVAATSVVDDAVEALKATVKTVQEACEHPFILHQKGYSSYFDHDTLRLCALCGLEEVGGVYESPSGFVKLRSEFICEESNIPARRIQYGASERRRVQYGRYLKEGESR